MQISTPKTPPLSFIQFPSSDIQPHKASTNTRTPTRVVVEFEAAGRGEVVRGRFILLCLCVCSCVFWMNGSGRPRTEHTHTRPRSENTHREVDVLERLRAPPRHRLVVPRCVCIHGWGVVLCLSLSVLGMHTPLSPPTTPNAYTSIHTLSLTPHELPPTDSERQADHLAQVERLAEGRGEDGEDLMFVGDGD